MAISTEELAKVEETQASLFSLSEKLERESAVVPEPVETWRNPELVQVAVQTMLPPASILPQEPARISKPQVSPLQACRVGAIGFGRQDIAGLAGAMIEEHARVEFLPRGGVEEYSGFDLLLLNCASMDVLKRELSYFQAVLASGIPTIVIGSRAALGVLRVGVDPRTWDFAAKPLHMDELIFRAANLLSRREEAGYQQKLPASVVVADSDPFTRTLIESALSREGIACELVEDGEAAWAAIEKFQPGAVILDLTLPNRDGFQLLADIRRAAGRKPKVIVLSARQSEADILRAFALGADDYLTKPFSPLELSARLTRLLGGAPENV